MLTIFRSLQIFSREYKYFRHYSVLSHVLQIEFSSWAHVRYASVWTYSSSFSFVQSGLWWLYNYIFRLRLSECFCCINLMKSQLGFLISESGRKKGLSGLLNFLPPPPRIIRRPFLVHYKKTFKFKEKQFIVKYHFYWCGHAFKTFYMYLLVLPRIVTSAVP